MIPDGFIEVEGDLPKVLASEKYFAEIRASLRNALDASRDLESENARLADALREIATAKFAVAFEIGSSVNYRESVKYLQRIAREALTDCERTNPYRKRAPRSGKRA